jgi:hypothetical protein
VPAGGTTGLDMKHMIAQASKPDDKGNPIPANATFGTLRVEPADGQLLERLMVTATVYDPVAGTCSCVYGICNTPTSLDLLADPLTGAVTTTQQVTATVQWDDGSSTDATLHTRFSSSASSVISIQNTPGTSGNGMATFGTVGAATITGFVSVRGGDPSIEPSCPANCVSTPVTGSTPGTGTPRIDSTTPAQGTIGTTVPVTILGQGFGSAPTLQTGAGIVPTVGSVSADGKTITASFAIAPNAAVGSYGVTVSVNVPDVGLVASNSVNFGVTPRIDSVTPSRGLIGATTSSVTITGQGFTGGHVNTPAAIQVSSITSATDTKIVLGLAISSTATKGKNSGAISVTASGQTSNAVDFFVQVPTSLFIVSPGAGAEGRCQILAGPGCGTSISFTYQVKDQDSPAPQSINAVMSFWDSFSATSPDPLQIDANGGFATTCSPANTGPCNKFTLSSGQFNEAALGGCSTICLVNSACVTGGPTMVDQTWHIADQPITQHISIYCEKVLVNGIKP